jgi:hypothetical protein
MRREIDDYHRSLVKRYVKSKRHTIQVDFLEHLAELSKERAAGARRSGRSRALRRTTDPATASSVA